MKFWGKIMNIMKTAEGDKITCDISDIMNSSGKFQLIQYVLICLPIMLVTISNINYIFVVRDLEYRCRVDECEDTNSTAQHPSWWPDTNIDRCSAPVLRRGEQVCTNNSFIGELASCHHWIYESNDTVVAELNLACQPWKSNLIGSIHSAGWLITMMLYGWMADKVGRKPVLIFSIVAGCIGYFKTFATSYYVYILIEFLEALGTGGNYSAAMVLLLEISSKKHRPMSGVIFTYSVYLGESLFALIAMYATHWKTITAIIYGPSIFFIFYIFLIDESPRWLIVNSRTQEAKKTFKKIANMNNIPINHQELENVDEAAIKDKFNIGKQEIKESFTKIFRSKEIVKRLLVGCFCRFSSIFIYYGMMVNTEWLPGNKYLNFFLTSLMSFPGELLSLILVYKVGRKIPLIAGFFLCGIFCLTFVFIPTRFVIRLHGVAYHFMLVILTTVTACSRANGYPWLKLTIFFIAKIVIAACFSSLITYTMELFPTSVRGTFVGVQGIFTRLANMIAPLTPMTNSTLHGLPFILFGSTSIISGMLLLLTPETKNLPLFDTIEQIEKYHKDASPLVEGASGVKTSTRLE